MLDLAGPVVVDHAVRRDYAHAATLTLQGLDWPSGAWSEDTLVSFDLGETVVTAGFVPVELATGRMFLDQSYAGVEQIFPARFQLHAGGHALRSDPVRLAGRHVVIGGPIDRVWYHWLFSWAPRLLLLRRLRPALFADPETRFLVHPLALEPPFRDVLESFGLPAERFTAADPQARDLLLERAVLVSFPSQPKLYPELIAAFAAHLMEHWRVRRRLGRPRRVFASRQDLAAPRRRIHNWEALAPALRRRGFRIAALGAMPARAQAELFHNADVVAGAHGSDLTGLLFCRPGAHVVVIEGAISVEHRLHLGLQRLCELRGLRYVLFPSAVRTPDAEPDVLVHRLLRDYEVDVPALGAVLDEVARRPREPAPAVPAPGWL